MPKPKKIMGFDPDYFEDQTGKIHRRPPRKRIRVRLCGYAVFVRPGASARRPPQVLVVHPQWKKRRREFPGGGVEHAESLVAGTQRELREELGIRVALPATAAIAFDRSFVMTWLPELVFCHAIASVFVARFPQGKAERIRLQEKEIHRMEWVDADARRPPPGLHPMFVPHWPAIVREARRLVS